MASTDIGTIFLDRQLRIQRFTPSAQKIFNLIPTDMGRPISDIKPNLRVEDLGGLITGVIDSLKPLESEAQDRDGHWYALRIRPYITLDNKIEGASIALVDIHTLRGELERMRQAQGRAGATS